MGNDSITAFRTREQLRRFLGMFSPRFSKPKLEFLGQMLFGIQAARDTLVSEIARSLQEDILSKRTQETLVRQCTMRYEDSVLFKSRNRVRTVRIRYGSMPVRLPVRPDSGLPLVVVEWPGGEKPMMLLTTLKAVRTRKAPWGGGGGQGYVTRWRVEDTIRFAKQSHRLEHIRLLDCQRLKNMAALAAAVAYFAAAWLGRKARLEALANHVAKVSRKMFEAPEFFYYAIADGSPEARQPFSKLGIIQ